MVGRLQRRYTNQILYRRGGEGSGKELEEWERGDNGAASAARGRGGDHGRGGEVSGDRRPRRGLENNRGTFQDFTFQRRIVDRLVYNAAKAGKEDTIRKLLAERVDLNLKNPRNVSLPWIAATYDHLRVVQVLLETENVDINAKSILGRPPISWAVAQGHEGIVRLLLEAEADRSLGDIDGKTPLSMAKKNGHDKIVKILPGG
jgi:hypothetical protein